MTDVQKQAIKDMLHLLVDKEELPLIQELVAKLPVQYAGILKGILDVSAPVFQASEDKAIDSI